MFYGLLGTVVVQCFAGVFACCFKSTHSDYEQLEDTETGHIQYDSYRDMQQQPQQTYNPVGGGQNGNAQTDEQQERAASYAKLREKYGFGTNQATGRAYSTASTGSERGL